MDKVEKLFEGWTWWIFRHLPFPHIVSFEDKKKNSTSSFFGLTTLVTKMEKN
jgi:hypothetical protein